MNRDKSLQQLDDEWDIIIIGGGATGLGSAVDAASRGYRTLLLEQADFAKGTSSRSTKLIHGGLRYLQQGNISLVVEALRERGHLCVNAPHLVHHLSFIVPSYHWWHGPFYGMGLKVYDLLAGKWGLEPSRTLTRQQTLRSVPGLEREGLRGGTLYYDGQFDDARLAITLAQTATDLGATLINYMKVTALIHKKNACVGVKAKDQESGRTHSLRAKVVINATGVFADAIRQMEKKSEKPLLEPSQGVHLVLSREFLPGKDAILVPHTEDKRVLFFIPWHKKLLIGTTDTSVKKITLEPKPLKTEVEFLLKYAARYLRADPLPEDILSVFAGLRPLVRNPDAKNTAALARDHTIIVSPSGLITIAGGKWTTYRKMAEDVIDKAIVIGNLPERPCMTTTLRLHGWKSRVDPDHLLSVYGSEAKDILALKRSKKLHSRLPYTVAQVIWAARHEMARTVEDVLSRRTRALLLDAQASIEAAPLVANLLAKELGKNSAWEKKEVIDYAQVAKNYIFE